MTSYYVAPRYVAAMGGTSMLVLLLAFFIVVEIARVGASLWLSVWSGAGRHPPHSVAYYIGIYAGISSGQVKDFLLLGTTGAWNYSMLETSLKGKQFAESRKFWNLESFLPTSSAPRGCHVGLVCAYVLSRIIKQRTKPYPFDRPGWTLRSSLTVATHFYP